MKKLLALVLALALSLCCMSALAEEEPSDITDMDLSFTEFVADGLGYIRCNDWLENDITRAELAVCMIVDLDRSADTIYDTSCMYVTKVSATDVAFYVMKSDGSGMFFVVFSPSTMGGAYKYASLEDVNWALSDSTSRALFMELFVDSTDYLSKYMIDQEYYNLLLTTLFDSIS